MHDSSGHIPVLPEQTLELLQLAPQLTILDCTLGRGGHAAMMIPHIQGGTYIGLDTDATNQTYAQARLQPIADKHQVKLFTVHCNFRTATKALDQHQIKQVDRLLADFGFASNQMDDPTRGMQFREQGPLDMRLDPSQAQTAADLVNQLPERELADLIYQNGEERLSRRIAKRIVEHRKQVGPIQTTSVLADLVYKCYGPTARKQRIHPATRTFMALRIAVNDELGALDQLLDQIPNLLAPNGIAGLISFHSLEDRRVKQRFLAWQQQELGKRLTRKPLVPTEQECQDNPRSRSAKMRGFHKAS